MFSEKGSQVLFLKSRRNVFLASHWHYREASCVQNGFG